MIETDRQTDRDNFFIDIDVFMIAFHCARSKFFMLLCR